SQLAIEVGTSKRLPQFINQFDRDAGEIVDEIERVLDLVSNARGELTKRGQFLRLHQAVLCGAQVLQRGDQFARAGFHAVEEADILNRDCSLVSESRRQLDLFLGKWTDLRARQAQHADCDTLPQHWNGESRSIIA